MAKIVHGVTLKGPTEPSRVHLVGRSPGAAGGVLGGAGATGAPHQHRVPGPRLGKAGGVPGQAVRENGFRRDKAEVSIRKEPIEPD